jgi:hypothetical protein
MSVTNAYPEKPIVGYKKTQVSMNDVITRIRQMQIPVEVKRSVYVVFRNESANGTRGVNHNYAGIQADSVRWPKEYDDIIIGTVVLAENQTRKQRRFVAFSSVTGTLMVLAGRLQARGIYVGGYAHKIAKMQVDDSVELGRVYQKEWVKGRKDAEPNAQEAANFASMYRQAKALFPKI